LEEEGIEYVPYEESYMALGENANMAAHFQNVDFVALNEVY